VISILREGEELPGTYGACGCGLTDRKKDHPGRPDAAAGRDWLRFE